MVRSPIGHSRDTERGRFGPDGPDRQEPPDSGIREAGLPAPRGCRRPGARVTIMGKSGERQ
jgi:hypothetical protein